MKNPNKIPVNPDSSNRKCYNPQECYNDMIQMGYDADYAKEFVNKQVRELKSRANNVVLRKMAIMSGRDPEGWATLEEIE